MLSIRSSPNSSHVVKTLSRIIFTYFLEKNPIIYCNRYGTIGKNELIGTLSLVDLSACRLLLENLQTRSRLTLLFQIITWLQNPEEQKGLKKKTLWEKGENAGYQHFLLFPTMFFFHVLEKFIPFKQYTIYRLQRFCIRTEPKFCRLVKS